VGQRANYVIVENGRRELWYPHGAANTIDVARQAGEEPRLAIVTGPRRDDARNCPAARDGGGRPWEINPVALIDTPQSVPADERRRILLNSIQADRRR
jgi:hypothetical protein